MSAYDDYAVALGQLPPTDNHPSSPPRVVQRQDGTLIEDTYLSRESALSGVDTLFGTLPSYQAYKKEKPEHRLILWHRLRGLSVKETAALSGYTPQSVSLICKQPWFQDAFVRLSSEMGKDSVQTFLSGEVLPALQRTVQLALTAESEAVQLAANREIMDRYLGKATVKIEQKLSGQIDNVVYDAAKLMEESAKLSEQLRARGITGAN